MKPQNTFNLEDINICEMFNDDIDEVLHIQTECGLSVWTKLDYQKEIENKDSLKKVAKLDDKVIGFAVVRLLLGSDSNANLYTSSEIYNIALSESFQNKGIGQMMFDEILSDLKKQSVLEVWLEVRESNTKAIKFYKRNGFRQNSVRKNYYNSPLENAYILKRVI